MLKIMFKMFYSVIATSPTSVEINNDWVWLEKNVQPILEAFDNEDDITEFVSCKVNSIIAMTATSVDGNFIFLLFYLLFCLFTYSFDFIIFQMKKLKNLNQLHLNFISCSMFLQMRNQSIIIHAPTGKGNYLFRDGCI